MIWRAPDRLQVGHFDFFECEFRSFPKIVAEIREVFRFEGTLAWISSPPPPPHKKDGWIRQ